MNPPGLDTLGRWLMVAGLVIVVLGGLIWLFGRIPGLKDLPGTLTFNLGGVTVFIPILASIVVSVVLTLILNLLARFLRH